ncbi:alpha/beta fold hydrolase [Siccirubricoccus deserti]
MAPRLAEHFHVVAADLRGYGDSSAPPEAPDHSNYSFRAMAQDQVEVMRALGHERFHVAGHDRGGRTTHRMCLDHPQAVIRAAVLDIVPTLDMWAAMDKEGDQWLALALHGAARRFPGTHAGQRAGRLVHAQEAAEADRRPEPHPTGDLGRVRPLLQREDHPRLLWRLPRGGDHRLRAGHCRSRPQAGDAAAGALGKGQQRRQALRRSARPLAAARRRCAWRGAAGRALHQRGSAGTGARLVPTLLRGRGSDPVGRKA